MTFEDETKRKEQWLEQEAERGLSFELPPWTFFVWWAGWVLVSLGAILLLG